jgi:hypothetical protein
MQEECEARLKVLEEAAASAQRMTSHGDADVTVGAFKVVLKYTLSLILHVLFADCFVKRFATFLLQFWRRVLFVEVILKFFINFQEKCQIYFIN